MDPWTVLGLGRDASAAEVREAYRREVKRWHPDRGAGEPGARRLRQVNEAYARLRHHRPDAGAPARRPPGAGATGDRGAADRATRSALLRARMGPELRRELHPDERVELCVPAATWASPQTLVVRTDRRLLWLLDDAPVGRVRSLPLSGIAGARLRPPGRLRRTARVELRDRAGRRTAFAGLRAADASALARGLAGGRGDPAPGAVTS